MQKARVLIVHNRYQQAGGEDAVVAAEADLLRRNGHVVVQYTRDNAEIADRGWFGKASLWFSTTWNRKSYAEVRSLIRRERPTVAHFHNTLPLVSPAAYYACRHSGVPVVQMLHNYRLLCPAGTLFRNGRRCDECRRGPGRAIARGCYRSSRAATAALAAMLATHRRAGTWRRAVDAYITPSRLCRNVFVEHGFSSEAVFYKPNFLDRDPGPRVGAGDYALFVGRLSHEKGVLEMLRAWQALPDIPLVIVGDGPLAPEARRVVEGSRCQVKVTGALPRQQVLGYMKGGRLLVFPSVWDEPFGMGLLEAAACGVPAIAARVGAAPELVDHRRTGLLFDPGHFEELTASVRWAWSHPDEVAHMGNAARQSYVERYTPEQNYQRLMEIYALAIAHSRQVYDACHC